MLKRNLMMTVAVILSCVVLPVLGGSFVTTDYDKAKEVAKSSNRYILLSFSGTEWCHICKKLEKEVFTQIEFKEYASANLVCVMLDFPLNKIRSERLPKKHKKLIKQFEVKVYPTTFLISPSGEKLRRLGSSGPAIAYVEKLKDIIDADRAENEIPLPVDNKKTVFKKSLVKKHEKGGTPAEFLKPLAKDYSREFRTWTSKNGSTLDAKALEEQGRRVVLEKEDGAVLKIYVSDLIKADREYITELKMQQ